MNKNSEMSGLIFIMAIIGTAMFFLAAIVFAVVTFIALALTMVCLYAWDEPVTLFGDTLEPAEARAFIGRGLIGVGLAIAFALFCGALYGVQVRGDAWVYVILAGYAAGSLGVAYLKARYGETTQVLRPDVSRLPPVIEHEPKPSPRSADAAPFRFASWDDEVESGASDKSDQCRGCVYNDEGYRPMPGVSQR